MKMMRRFKSALALLRVWDQIDRLNANALTPGKWEVKAH